MDGVIGVERYNQENYHLSKMSFLSLCVSLGKNGLNGNPRMEHKEVREYAGFLMFCSGDTIFLTRTSDFAKDYLLSKGCNFSTDSSKVRQIDFNSVDEYIRYSIDKLSKQGLNYDQIVSTLFKNDELRVLGALNGDQILSGLQPMRVEYALYELAENSEYFNKEKYKETFKKNVVPTVDTYVNNLKKQESSFTID